MTYRIAELIQMTLSDCQGHSRTESHLNVAFRTVVQQMTRFEPTYTSRGPSAIVELLVHSIAGRFVLNNAIFLYLPYISASLCYFRCFFCLQKGARRLSCPNPVSTSRRNRIVTTGYCNSTSTETFSHRILNVVLWNSLPPSTDFGSLSAFKRTIKLADLFEFLSFTF